MNHGESTQPSKDDAYKAPENPVSNTPAESKASEQQSSLNDTAVFSRRPGDQPGITPQPSALAAGSSHADAVDDTSGPADTEYGEQMATYAEGDVMKAQERKTGTGEEQSLTQDLDRKKAEQQEARERIRGQRDGGVEGASDLQSGGPATTRALEQKS